MATVCSAQPRGFGAKLTKIESKVQREHEAIIKRLPRVTTTHPRAKKKIACKTATLAHGTSIPLEGPRLKLHLANGTRTMRMCPRGIVFMNPTPRSNSTDWHTSFRTWCQRCCRPCAMTAALVRQCLNCVSPTRTLPDKKSSIRCRNPIALSTSLGRQQNAIRNCG